MADLSQLGVIALPADGTASPPALSSQAPATAGAAPTTTSGSNAAALQQLGVIALPPDDSQGAATDPNRTLSFRVAGPPEKKILPAYGSAANDPANMLRSFLHGVVPFGLGDMGEAAAYAATQPGSFGDTYHQQLKALQDENAAFSTQHPLASAIATGTGMAFPGAAALKGVKYLGAPLVRALPEIPGLSQLGARLIGLSPEAAETIAATTAPSAAPEIAGPLVRAGLKTAGGIAVSKIPFIGKTMADFLGASTVKEGVGEGWSLLKALLRHRAIEAARTRLGADLPGPPIPPEGPSMQLSFPGGEAGQPVPVQAPARPLLQVPPGYTYGQGMTPPGGPSSWTGYQAP